MKWIVEIISKEPYKVTCRWNDNRITTIDLHWFIMEKAKNPKNSYSQLLNAERFIEVQCDGTTLCWAKGISFTDTDGSIKLGVLDIAPELLYDIAHGFDNKKALQNV